jgi:hypothetical protein
MYMYAQYIQNTHNKEENDNPGKYSCRSSSR